MDGHLSVGRFAVAHRRPVVLVVGVHGARNVGHVRLADRHPGRPVRRQCGALRPPDAALGTRSQRRNDVRRDAIAKPKPKSSETPHLTSAQYTRPKVFFLFF